MAWVLLDFFCDSCNSQFEDLVDSSTRESPVPCPTCGSLSFKTLSAPNVAAFSIKDKSFQLESLKKRSAEHTAKTVASEGIPQMNRKYSRKKK